MFLKCSRVGLLLYFLDESNSLMGEDQLGGDNSPFHGEILKYIIIIIIIIVHGSKSKWKPFLFRYFKGMVLRKVVCFSYNTWYRHHRVTCPTREVLKLVKKKIVLEIPELDVKPKPPAALWGPEPPRCVQSVSLGGINQLLQHGTGCVTFSVLLSSPVTNQ